MITNTDLRYLKLAETMSQYSDYNRIHIGSCVVKKRSVISTGCNKNKTHPVQEKYNIDNLDFKKRKAVLHAEVDALIKAGTETKGATLYIFRRGKDNLYRISKPCAACMKYIIDCGIKRVVYTVENGIKEMIF